MKRVLCGILAAVLVLSLLPALNTEVNAVSDPVEYVAKQIQEQAAKINQKDAAKTAATALLTNATLRDGKDLSFDKSSAVTAMVYNSVVAQDLLTHTALSMADAMVELNRNSMACCGSLSWYMDSSCYDMRRHLEYYPDERYAVGSVTSGDIYGSYSYFNKYFNDNDEMLVMVAGSAGAYYDITRLEVKENTALYELNVKIFDNFDFDAEYSNSGDNLSFEEILSLFGKLTMHEFYWECKMTFRLEIPYSCNHETGAYHWVHDRETHEMVSETAGGLLYNPTVKNEFVRKLEDGSSLYSYWYELRDSVVLRHDAPWYLEYVIYGMRNFALSPVKESGFTLNTLNQSVNSTTFRYSQVRFIDHLGYERATHAYGADYTNQYSTTHTFRFVLQNVIHDDESNMVYLTVYDLELDAVVQGPVAMDTYYASTYEDSNLRTKEKENNWISGKDFTINYIGTRNNQVTEQLLSVSIYENGMGGENTDAFRPQNVAPTCTGQGYTLHTCYKCGYNYKTNYTDRLAHDYKQTIVAPTCTDEGYTEYKCRECGDSYRTDMVEKLPHEYGGFVSNNDATCAHDGTKTGKCTVCGEKVTVTDEGTALPHTWTDATCEKAKTCKFCGATQGDPLGHDLKHYNAKAPTCENVGWDAYEKCQRCNHSTFARLPALGHDYRNGVCIRCGDRDGTIVPGEVTGDGKIDMADAYQIILYLSGKAELTEVERLAADVNGDGGVDMLDVYRVMLTYKETIGRR